MTNENQELKIESKVDFKGLYGEHNGEIIKKELEEKVIRSFFKANEHKKVEIKNIVAFFKDHEDLFKFLPNKDHLNRNKNITLHIKTYPNPTEYILGVSIQYYNNIPFLHSAQILEIKAKNDWRTC